MNRKSSTLDGRIASSGTASSTYVVSLECFFVQAAPASCATNISVSASSIFILLLRESEAHEGSMRLTGPEDAAREVRVIGCIRKILRLYTDSVPARIRGLQVIGAIYLQSGKIGLHAHTHTARGRKQLGSDGSACIDGPAMIVAGG